MSKNNIQLLKGFRDYLPSEQIARRKIISKISEVFERFGFGPIETPALEQYELFQGKLGEDEKLMYKFQDLGGRDVALRYELTLPLVRVVSTYPDLPNPFKRYQIGGVFRADNPQKGRFREFTQCDADIVGTDSKIADAEVIAAIFTALKELEIANLAIKFNNREIIDEVLSELNVPKTEVVKFMRLMDKMDKIGIEKIRSVLEDQGFTPKLLDEYSELMVKKSKKFVEEFTSLLESFGVTNLEFDKYLMRGLDYYTSTVFEFKLIDKPEFGSIAGGGRYDNLFEKVSGKKIPAVGGSIGLDRLFAALQDAGKISPQTAAEVIIFNLDNNLTADYLNMATNLRAAGIDTEFYYDTVKMDKQFKYAEGKNMQVAVIYGAEEAKKRVVNLKNLAEKKQVSVNLDDLVNEVKSMLW
jgi:histidyl-tRNA synthetase